MKDFLEHVAEDILSKYGTDLSRTVVVFPNKRASLFLNEHLARLAKRPLWSPAYVTISELFRQQSELQVADSIKLVCDLHKSFCSVTGSTETLDRFYGWGQLMISDFDDIDKNMADADRVFANLRDLHELDDISYLTDEQRDMLRHFFSNFTEDHDSLLKERFLQLWSRFAEVYHDFNRRLRSQQLAYEGALYRSVVEQTANSMPKDAPAADRYLFVGFNLVQKVEQRLFAQFQQQGKAFFYWDFDHYYLQHHEAGRYINSYMKYFPNELDSHAADIYDNFSHISQLTCISAPTEHIQARYVSSWLRQKAEGDTDSRLNSGRRTAIVLCDESLLPTVIHCLPDEVQKVNITTGYPLSQTSVASFIQQYFELHLGGHTPRLLRIIQRHPYAKYVETGGGKLEADDVKDAGKGKKTVAIAEPAVLTSHLLNLLRLIGRQSKQSNDPLFQESVFRAFTLVNRIDGLIANGDLYVTPQTLQRLIMQVISQTTIPFHGEPAEGIQVMGVLETRNLDFDHVLLLSCNEGNMPRGVNDSSFIPHSIRQAYELTTIDNKVAIYAYYFHRLLQRATDVTVVYNNATDEGRKGEVSRFIQQLLAESGHHVNLRQLQAGSSVTTWGVHPIEKTPHVMQLLHSLVSPHATPLSPTAVNSYLRCQLIYYYRYIANLQQPDDPDDETAFETRLFGNVFHDAADLLYRQMGSNIDRRMLDHLLSTPAVIERAVDQAFHDVMPQVSTGGLHLISREVIIRYLRQLLTIDRRLAPFTILGLECDVYRQLSVSSLPAPLRIGGRIDRLDLTSEGQIRVVDYKTGSSRLKPLPDVDSIFDPARIHDHSDYYLQTFLYADCVSRVSHGDHSAFSTVPVPEAMRVAPALLFIQRAAADGYNPVLTFGRELINDVADHAERYDELLRQTVAELFDAAIPFTPTADMSVCRKCPYLLLCRGT